MAIEDESITTMTLEGESGRQTPRRKFKTLTKDDGMDLSPFSRSMECLNKDVGRHRALVEAFETSSGDDDNTLNKDNNVHWSSKRKKFNMHGSRS